jgi:hypothetical protein
MASYKKTQILEPFIMETLIFQKNHLLEIKLIFDELNITNLETNSMSFNTLLVLSFINNETYINALKVKLKKKTIILQRLWKDICTNPFEIINKMVKPNCVYIFT